MPTVTALQPQAGNLARIKVHLDGEFALGLSGGRAAEWHVGQVLTEAQVELVRTAEAVDSGVKAVRRLLDVRPRTDGEMRARLLRKGFAAAEVEQIMQRVEQADGSATFAVGLRQDSLRAFLEYAATHTGVAPRDARFTFDVEQQALRELKPGTPGRALNIDRTLAAINSGLPQAQHRIALEFDTLQPPVSGSTNAADLGIRQLVAEATTHFRGSSNARIQNILAGAANARGVLVAPGAEFSFNNALGDVSLDKGFAEALVIFAGDQKSVV